MNDDWPTTRTYPRSLAEAFPDDPENSCAITVYTSKPLDLSDLITICCTLIVLSLTILAFIHH